MIFASQTSLVENVGYFRFATKLGVPRALQDCNCFTKSCAKPAQKMEKSFIAAQSFWTTLVIASMMTIPPKQRQVRNFFSKDMSPSKQNADILGENSIRLNWRVSGILVSTAQKFNGF